jgi:WS/DGAT/MGAT family acyltransferase
MTNAFKPDAHKALALLSAPSTPLNAAITAERSFAAVTVSLERVKAVAASAGGKVNDVVLALAGGMLRRYLQRHEALPRRTLTAFVPISARERGDAQLKNQVFGMVVPLATDVDDAKERLGAIVAGAAASKELANPFRALLPHFAEIPTFGAPMLLQLLAVFYGRSRLANSLPPPVNVVVSNVLFSRAAIYIAGARIEHVFPMSIPVHGQGLNVTVHGYVDGLDFGLIAGAGVVPDIDDLAALLPFELDALERAYGLAA